MPLLGDEVQDVGSKPSACCCDHVPVLPLRSQLPVAGELDLVEVVGQRFGQLLHHLGGDPCPLRALLVGVVVVHVQHRLRRCRPKTLGQRDDVEVITRGVAGEGKPSLHPQPLGQRGDEEGLAARP